MNDSTELPRPNIPLLRKAVEWAEAEAAKTDGTCMWDQSWWVTETSCGTAYCIAGYVVSQQSGFTKGGEYYATVDGSRDTWDSQAAALLGIPTVDGDKLFAPANDIATVRRVAEQIAARAGERL
jgi:hypothetical protein